MTPNTSTDNTKKHTHKAVSPDGTEIVGHVQGEGPPLVLLPAGPGNSEVSWRHIVPYLSREFTCYLLNTRGRGQSSDTPDHSPERLTEDIVAFAESIGEPVGLAGWGSVQWTHVAAEHPEVVSAVAAYEPAANEVRSDEDQALFQAVLTRMGELAAENRLEAAAHTLVEAASEAGLYTDEDMVDGAAPDFWEASAENVPVLLQELRQEAEFERPGPTDPSVLAKIHVPLFLLYGTRTSHWATDAVHHISDHASDPHVHEIEGAGHFGPWTHPEAVAGAFAEFFATAHAEA